MSLEDWSLWAVICANLAATLWTLLRACQTWKLVRRHLKPPVDTPRP